MLTLRQLIRRPRTQEEIEGQTKFYRSITFGVGLHIAGFAAGWILVEVIRG